MSEIWNSVYYGNTVLEWSISLGIILSSVLLAKALYWITGKTIKQLTQRTKTKLDDILVDKLEEPAVLAIVLIGFSLALHRLHFAENIQHFLDKAVYLAIAIDVTWFAVRIIDALMEEYLTPFAQKSDTKLDDQLVPLVRKGTRTIIWILGIIVGLNNAGFDVAALIAGLGIGGLALALAAQDTVKNIFGGLMIFIDKPFKINDRIKIDGFDGWVTEIGLRSTRLRTLEGRIITIPNGHFSENAIENVTLEPSRKIVTTLGLTYDTAANRVEEAQRILRELVTEVDGINHEETITFFGNFGNFSLDVSVIYFIKPDQDFFAVQNAVNLKILQKFNAAGLEFAFPTQTIFKKELN